MRKGQKMDKKQEAGLRKGRGREEAGEILIDIYCDESMPNAASGEDHPL